MSFKPVRLRVNEEIKAKEVRVIDTDSKQIGILPIKEALALASERGLDLVEVSPHANPPVCKIIDYGKYKFELAKRAKEAKKKQKQIKIKEIKMGVGIEEHDYKVKRDHIAEFLSKGYKTKVVITFKGRQIMYSELGHKILDRLINDLKDIAVVDKPPHMEGKFLVCILGSNPNLKRIEQQIQSESKNNQEPINN